jgi:CheY-like chemotaxis protein
MSTHPQTKAPVKRSRGRDRTSRMACSGENHVASAAHQLPIRPAGSRPAAKGKRILVVDDDRGVRESLIAVLTDEGYIALPAGDGLQALDLAATTPLDLVLLDLNMPVKNGWDTFERLSYEHPTVPVVIITARPNQWFMAASAGVGALLEKPLDIPTLLETIARLLAAPPEVHLARLAGRKADFVYSPGHPGPARIQPDSERGTPAAGTFRASHDRHP